MDPDLAVGTNDIVFTPEAITEFPQDVDITVTVWNKGRTPVVGTTLVLYEGSIGGSEIGRRSLDVSGMNSESAVFSVPITEGWRGPG